MLLRTILRILGVLLLLFAAAAVIFNLVAGADLSLITIGLAGSFGMIFLARARMLKDNRNQSEGVGTHTGTDSGGAGAPGASVDRRAQTDAYLAEVDKTFTVLQGNAGRGTSTQVPPESITQSVPQFGSTVAYNPPADPLIRRESDSINENVETS
jgi:hypothetical protein